MSAIMNKILAILVVALFSLVLVFESKAKEITIPINLEYELLDALLVQSSFTDPNQTAQLLYEAGGCLELRLSEPHFSGGANVVNLASKIFIHLGTPLGENCLMPYQWSGSIEISQIPQLNSSNWDLTFQTVDTKIFSADGQEIDSFDVVFKRLLPLVNEHMREFAIKLDSPVEDLRTFLLPMFTPEARSEAEQLLNSIRPGAITANETTLMVNVHADAVEVAATEADEGVET